MNLTARLARPLAALVFAVLPACGGDDSSGTSDASTSDAATTDDAATADAGATAPAAPTITMLMKMTGGLHVSWTNATKDCDTIIGERKTAADAYVVAFTVPGAADNKHDGLLTAGTTYTYRLHCVRGGLSSPFSNEMSGTP
jgi:hypothetical protein